MPGQTFLKDKPYEFVPLLDQCKLIEYGSQRVMKERIYSGKLGLKITVLSPLHIGSKQQAYDNNGNMIKTQMRRNGKIVIPGSSLKGAVRSVAEAVSYSCAVKVPDVKLKEILPLQNNSSCSSARKLCMTCYIFGMMSRVEGYKGRVQFGEFVLQSGNTESKKLPKLESPFKNYPKVHDKFGTGEKRNNYGNERLYYCSACSSGDCENCTKEEFFQNIDFAGINRKMEFRGRKFYSTQKELVLENHKETQFEMIAPGSVLTGEVLFQNLGQEEGRLLAYVLDIGHFFTLKLGYGKPLGYGKVQIDLESAEGIGSRYPSVAGIDKELVESWAQEYRTDNTDEIQSVIGELERIMSDAQRSYTTDSY